MGLWSTVAKLQRRKTRLFGVSTTLDVPEKTLGLRTPGHSLGCIAETELRTWRQDSVGLRQTGVGKNSKSEGAPASSTFEGSSEAPVELAAARAVGQKEVPRLGIQRQREKYSQTCSHEVLKDL